jgi:hypothetical protein
MIHRLRHGEPARTRHRGITMIRRARMAFLGAITTVLLAAAHVPGSRAALDPAAGWRALLQGAGCPPQVAHDLAVRIERMAGPAPGPDHEGAITAMQRAEQVTHLAVGQHGLRLTAAQLDAALMALFGHPAMASPNSGSGTESTVFPGQHDRTPHASAAPPHQSVGQLFTTRQAVELLCEWLPTPARR